VIEVLRRFQRDAFHEAALTRFRPIMMTTMVALMGALPIALGIAVVGGLLVSPLRTLQITPVIYIYLERFQKRMRGASLQE